MAAINNSAWNSRATDFYILTRFPGFALDNFSKGKTWGNALLLGKSNSLKYQMVLTLAPAPQEVSLGMETSTKTALSLEFNRATSNAVERARLWSWSI